MSYRARIMDTATILSLAVLLFCLLVIITFHVVIKLLRGK